ncbi:MAG: AI-2E family transporter, partial [Acidobacteriota bacterium]|nr:AI-2E family transporter [Acidobacteriota bacterium]
LLVIVVSMAAVGGISYIIFNQIVQVATELPSYQENIDNKLRALRMRDTGALGRAAKSVQKLGKELNTVQDTPPPPASARAARVNTPANPLPVQVIEAPPSALVYLRDLTGPFLAPLAILGIVLVFTLFLLVEEADLRNRLFRLAGMSRLNVMTQALDDATQRVSRYLMLQFLVNAGFGALCGLGLYLIGVPYAALWGTVAALLRIVPYIGSVVAGLLPLVVSLAVFNTWLQPLLVFALFTTLEIITGNLLEPRLYGSHTGISSLALLLTTVFWAALWGPVGLILSTPLTVCVVVLGRHVPHLAFLHILLGDQPALTPEAHLYQRLLAMDESEARAVLEAYRAENSLLQLYDAVILPALTMAEQDRHKGALDPEREEFLFLSLREVLAEYSESAQNASVEHAAQHLALAPPGRILCLPAHDEADEIAAAMLAQLLEQGGKTTVSFPVGTSSGTMLDLVAPTADDVFCISALPPFAFSHARTLNRQLGAKYPQTKILIGVWGFTGEIERALQRFQPKRPDKFVSNLAEALEYLGVGPQTPSDGGPSAGSQQGTEPALTEV